MSQKIAFVKQGEGGAQPNISKEKIIATLMPLPSLAEQYRIVAKIKELLPDVKRYRETYSAVNSLNAAFPNLLKKSILQEAVQGKLVPQDPNVISLPCHQNASMYADMMNLSVTGMEKSAWKENISILQNRKIMVRKYG